MHIFFFYLGGDNALHFHDMCKTWFLLSRDEEDDMA